jgi:hypothetical protein
VALAAGAALLDQACGCLLRCGDGALGLGAGRIEHGGGLGGRGVAELLRLGAEREGVLLRPGPELVALDPRGLDLLVARARGRRHQQGGLLVGVDHDGRRLLRRPGQHLLGLSPGASGLRAVGLGLGLELAQLLAERGQLGRQCVGLLPGLAHQLVGDLLGTGQQGRGGGLARSCRGGVLGHPPTPSTRSEGLIVAARDRA